MFARVFAAVAAVCGLMLWLGAFVSVAAWLKARETLANPGPSPAQTSRCIGVLVVAASTAGCLVLTGAVLVPAPALTVPFLVLLLAVPPVWLWVGMVKRRCRAEEDRPARQHEELVCAAPLVPEQLSTHELCLAWRLSYIVLLDLPAGPARYEIAEMRKGLLDELERRDRDGFARWLQTSARAGSDPGPYLTTRPVCPDPTTPRSRDAAT